MSHDNVVTDYLTSLAKEVGLDMPDLGIIATYAYDAIRAAALEGEDGYNRLQRAVAIYMHRRNLCVAFWGELLTQTWNGRRWMEELTQTLRVYFSGMAIMLFEAGCIELESSLFRTYLGSERLDYIAMQTATYPGVMQRLSQAGKDKATELSEKYQASFQAVGWPPMVKSEPLRGE
jgi:hypothetical protein